MNGKCFHSQFTDVEIKRDDLITITHELVNDTSRTNPFHCSEIYFIPISNSKTLLPLGSFRQQFSSINKAKKINHTLSVEAF